MQPENTASPPQPPQPPPSLPESSKQTTENETIPLSTPNSPKDSTTEDKTDSSAESAVNISTNEALGAINSPNAIEAIKGRIIATHLLLTRLRANEEKLSKEMEFNKELTKEVSELKAEIVTLKNALKASETTEAQHRGQQVLIEQLEAKVEDLMDQLAKSEEEKKSKTSASNLQKKITKLENDLKEKDKTIASLNASLKESNKANKQLEESLQKTSKELEEHEAAYMELAVNSDCKTEELNEDLLEAQNDLKKCQDDLKSLKNELEKERKAIRPATVDNSSSIELRQSQERIKKLEVQKKEDARLFTELENKRKKELESLEECQAELKKQKEQINRPSQEFPSQMAIFINEIDTLKKQKALIQDLFAEAAIRVKELENRPNQTAASEQINLPNDWLRDMEELRQYRQQASVAKDSLKKIETTPRPNQPQRKDSVELDDYEIEYTSYDNDPENELNSHAAPSSSIKTPQQAQPPAPLSNVVNPSKAKFRSSDLIAPEPLVSLPPKSTTRRTAPPSKLEKFVKSRLPSRMTSASSTTRKRINSLDTISATDKPKKQKKNDLSILKDFHFQPEVSQTDIEKALPPGTSSYLTPASRIPTEAKTNTISTPTTIATPTSTVTPTATTTTTAPPIKNINNVPVTHSSTPLGITPQANAFKAPFAVPKPANPLPATPIEELLEQRSNNSGNNLTVANAINPIELRAIIDSSIKKSPTFIVSRLGDTSEFKIEVIDGALSAVESILQGLKTHGNPILKQDSFPLQRTVYGSVNEFRFESPVCFDNKEKALACLLIGLISICPDHESAYQYITKWIFGKAFRLTKDGKINLACRYTRILSLICRNIDDIQRLRVFCYDIIRFSPVTTNFVGILLNVAVVWPEVLFTGSHDFSQVGEEVIPKILQSTTAAYCKHHDALEAAKSTYVVLAQLCNWVPLSSSLSLEQCCTELSKALNLELLKQLMRSCPEAFYDLAFNLKQAYAILFRRIEDSNTLNSFVVNTLDPNLNDPKIGLFYAEIKGILQHQRNTAEN